MNHAAQHPDTHASSRFELQDGGASLTQDCARGQQGLTRRSFSTYLATAAVGTLGLACTACGAEDASSDAAHLVTSAVPGDIAAPGTGDAPAYSGDTRITFCAVGDNLANERTLEIAEMWGGAGSGDGVYDFSPPVPRDCAHRERL